MSAEHVHVQVVDEVATLRIDRPKMNALSLQVQAEIAAAAREVDRRSDVAAVVVWGGGRVFAAGADVKEMADMSFVEMSDASRSLQEFTHAIARISKPTVAAVNGYALGGGCEVALATDVRICAADAVFGQPEIRLGIMPGGGGTQRLTRLIGPARAKDIILTGRFVSADEALTIGLVNEVVPPAEVYNRAVAWAAQFVGGPRHALRAVKDAIDRGTEVDLETGLEIERALFASLFATDDRTAGMRAFITKGPDKAVFSGK